MESRTVTPAELGIPAAFPLPRRRDWRIGMVGFGGIARCHLDGYRSQGWSVAAICDTDPAARAAAAVACPSARICEDYRDLVRDERVEVVSLLTQPTLRLPVVEACAAAGKPLQTEKPLAGTVEEAERMAAVADRAGIRLAVGQNRRWSPANFMAHQIIRAGLIGEPFYASVTIHDRQDVVLAQHPFYSRCTDFLTVQWDNHMADLQRYWTGRDAVRVLACTRRMKGQNFVSDNLLLVVTDFGEGVTGHVTHSELLRSALTESSCRVDGDRGSLVFELAGPRLQIDSAVLGGGPTEMDLSGVAWHSSLCGPMADLLISIEQDREPLVSARRNLPTIRAVVAEDRSARAGGRWVEC